MQTYQKRQFPVNPPVPEFSSGYVAQSLDTSRRRIELFLGLERFDLVRREISRIGKASEYLRVNFPAEALAMGPVLQ